MQREKTQNKTVDQFDASAAQKTGVGASSSSGQNLGANVCAKCGGPCQCSTDTGRQG